MLHFILGLLDEIPVRVCVSDAAGLILMRSDRRLRSDQTYFTKLSSSLLDAPIGGPFSVCFGLPDRKYPAVMKVVPRVAMASCCTQIDQHRFDYTREVQC
jgi:hypothetical protein